MDLVILDPFPPHYKGWEYPREIQDFLLVGRYHLPRMLGGSKGVIFSNCNRKKPFFYVEVGGDDLHRYAVWTLGRSKIQLSCVSSEVLRDFSLQEDRLNAGDSFTNPHFGMNITPDVDTLEENPIVDLNRGRPIIGVRFNIRDKQKSLERSLRNYKKMINTLENPESIRRPLLSLPKPPYNISVNYRPSGPDPDLSSQ